MMSLERRRGSGIRTSANASQTNPKGAVYIIDESLRRRPIGTRDDHANQDAVTAPRAFAHCGEPWDDEASSKQDGEARGTTRPAPGRSPAWRTGRAVIGSAAAIGMPEAPAPAAGLDDTAGRGDRDRQKQH